MVNLNQIHVGNCRLKRQMSKQRKRLKKPGTLQTINHISRQNDDLEIIDTIDHISRLITGANCHIVIVISEGIMIYQSQTARKLDGYIIKYVIPLTRKKLDISLNFAVIQKCSSSYITCLSQLTLSINHYRQFLIVME